MGNFDRQVANALVRLHRELFGHHSDTCRWHYNGKSDIYHCPHMAIYGKDLMPQVPDWVRWNNTHEQSKEEL